MTLTTLVGPEGNPHDVKQSLGTVCLSQTWKITEPQIAVLFSYMIITATLFGAVANPNK
jgi:hypothetical protein